MATATDRSAQERWEHENAAAPLREEPPTTVSGVPIEALSMGMATILHARQVVLLATGKSKARCIERLVNGPLTPKPPASFLQLHRDVELVLDTAAAALLQDSQQLPAARS